MPLTDAERVFLDAYVYEATSGSPFGGPATKALSQMGIWHSDLSWLLTAYQRQLNAEGQPSTGIPNPNPPPPPWKDSNEVKLRNNALKGELECKPTGQQADATTGHGVSFDLDEAKRTLATERHRGRPLADILRDLHAREAGK
jgi:hypothetical protein